MSDPTKFDYLALEAYVKAGAGNGETLKTRGYGVVKYDPNGGSRTGVILEAGFRDGQQVFIMNTADASESITFATQATSHVANGDSVAIGRYDSVLMTYNATDGYWHPNLGATSVADSSVTTAKIIDAAVTSAKIDSSVIQVVEVELTATEIVGTAAGDIGHASGAVLVAAEADVIHEFISAVLIYDFDTAAYTGGSNDLGIRQGTTAVSALIADADLVGDTADDIAFVNALSAADIKLTANSTLNLKGTAYTQPGTAAGVLRVRVAYRSHPAGLA